MQKIMTWLSAALVFLGFSSGAFAASHLAGVQGVFTTLATDFATVAGYGWVLFLVIVGGLALFGIVRRVVSRVAR